VKTLRDDPRIPWPLILATTLLVSASPGAAWARDCPSLVQGHLWTLGETLELGGELRLFYFGVSVGGVSGDERSPGDLPTARLDGERGDFENNVFVALRPLLYWYPVDGLTIAFEHEARFRWPGWEENAVPGTDFAVPGFDHRPTVAFIEGQIQGLTITAGLQPLSFGSAAILDQRFLALAMGYDHRVFRVDAFGGMTMRHLMRNAGHSTWMSYTSSTNGWKFTSNDPTENWAVGLTFSLKILRPYRLQLLYLYSRTTDETLESHAIGLHFAGPIWRPYLSFYLEPLLSIAPNAPGGEVSAMPGLVAELRARFGDDNSAPQLSLGVASSFLHDAESERRFAAVYENLSLGYVRRFNLHQGHIGYGRFAWQAHEYVRLFANYYAAFPDGASSMADELDLGVGLRINDLYRLDLAYVGMNLAQDNPSHGLYAELRIIIGPFE
jgi:hypothetical protein